MNSAPLPERIFRPIEFDPFGGCHLWSAGLTADGYAKTWLNGKNRLAHCVIYEALHGAVPAGLELDHLCRNRCCVNPAHLEPVTGPENQRRAMIAHANGAPRKPKSTRSTCLRGHPFVPETTLVTKTGKLCLICRRDRTRRRYAEGRVNK